ncbi:hypothetical protein CA2015_3498 [Cyclobacterium amurskyense]|uniref:Uncharacterized protein n=1 Tax=Cyclobacterium amurskyense TaxID=320787 RepID=A0A0H4PEH9_9BACT|nr:hypothetical protein CA2015_3498 [Cyclobacterium amurskyense]
MSCQYITYAINHLGLLFIKLSVSVRYSKGKTTFIIGIGYNKIFLLDLFGLYKGMETKKYGSNSLMGQVGPYGKHRLKLAIKPSEKWP